VGALFVHIELSNIPIFLILSGTWLDSFSLTAAGVSSIVFWILLHELGHAISVGAAGYR